MNKITMDDRLHATHVSLYISLFTLWNLNRFDNPISINREEVMKISKIGSKHTYHKCMKQLHEYGYLRYLPSHNPLRGSHVHMFNFSTSNEQAMHRTNDKKGTSSEQALHPSLNYINSTNNKKSLNSSEQKNDDKNFSSGRSLEKKLKTRTADEIPLQSGKNVPPGSSKKVPPEETVVMHFFKSENYPEKEARKFYNYFRSVGWKVGKNKPMEDWHAAAHNWMLNTETYSQVKDHTSQPSQLHTNSKKNYGEPL